MRSNDILKMIFREYKNVIPYNYVTFIDPYISFLNKKGQPIENYYVDGLHINEQGYQVYTNEIKKIFS